MTERDRITLVVNGEERNVPEGATISDLLAALDLAAGMIVVEHNRTIVERGRYEDVVLREGDRLELVHFVGGG